MSIWADFSALLVATGVTLVSVPGCGSSTKPVDPPAPPVDAGPLPALTAVDAGAPPAPVDAGPPPVVDAGPPAAPKVKVQYIGMHVGGGPFDDATKKPFETTLAPHHPAAAQCWAEHIKRAKPFDMGVDLLIEASGGHPKVSNPRLHLEKGEDDGQFVACITGVFEAVEFPPLARGKSGVSYSLRYTPTP